MSAGLLVMAANAQTGRSRKKEDFAIGKFRVESISIGATDDTMALKHMKGITIIDARSDTSRIGFMQKKIVDPFLGSLNSAAKNQTEQRISKRPIFITLKDGLQEGASRFIQQTVSFSGNDSLPGILMVIKKMWLSDELNFASDKKGRFTAPANKDSWTSGIDTRIEFYLRENDGYYPMYRWDSVISKAMTVSEYGPEFIAMALRLSMERLKQMDAKIDIILQKRQFTLAEISLHNYSEFTLPILTAPAPKAGLYMNFDEFKNNTPSQETFELKKERLEDIVYIKQTDGTDYLVRDIWGYSDGRNAYIKSAGNFFLLQRSANAFYIYGAKNVKHAENPNSTAGVAGFSYAAGSNNASPVYYTSSRTYVQLEPFQLDWSNGKLF